MKDLPHHVKQLNRKIIRSERRESEKESEEEEALLKKSAKLQETKDQARKKAKMKQKKQVKAHVPHPQSPEERNDLMKKRVPVRKKRSHFYPNASKPSSPHQKGK